MARVEIKFEGSAVQVGDSIDKLSRQLEGLVGDVKRTSDKLNARTRELEANFRNTFDKIGGAIKTFGLTIGGLVTGGGLAIATKQAVEFETAVANVGTLLGKSLPLLGQYEEGIKAIAGSTSKDLVDLTAGLYDTISAGISSTTDAGKALEFLNQAQKAAVAGLSTTQDAVRAGTTVLNVYGAEAGTVSQIFDKFFQTVRDGVTTFPQIAQSLGNVITSAKNAGVSFDEMLASLAQLTKGGVATAEASTQLRQLFLALAAPTKRVTKELANYGITLDETTLRNKGLASVLDDVIQKTGGNLEILRRVLGSTEALNAALVLGAKGTGEFREEWERIASAVGAAGEAFEIQSQTAAFQLGALRSSFEVFAADVYKNIQPALVGFLKDFSGAIADIDSRKVADALKTIGSALSSLVSILEVFGKTIVTVFAIRATNALGRFTTGALAAAQTGMLSMATSMAKFPALAGAATTAATGFGAALRFALGPIGLIITAIEALIVLFTGLSDAIDSWAEKSAEAFLQTKESIEALRKLNEEGRKEFEQRFENTDLLAARIEKDKIALGLLNEQIAAKRTDLDLALRKLNADGASADATTRRTKSIREEIAALEARRKKIEENVAAIQKAASFGPADDPSGRNEEADKRKKKALEQSLELRRAAEKEAIKLARTEEALESEKLKRDLESYKKKVKSAEKAAQAELAIRADAEDRYAQRAEEAIEIVAKRRMESEERARKYAEETAQRRLEQQQNLADGFAGAIQAIGGGLDGIAGLLNTALSNVISKAIEAGDVLKAGFASAGQVLLDKFLEFVALAGATDILSPEQAARGTRRAGLERGLAEQNLAAAQRTAGLTREEIARQVREDAKGFKGTAAERQQFITDEIARRQLEAQRSLLDAEDALTQAIADERMAQEAAAKGAFAIALDQKAAESEAFIENLAANLPTLFERLPAFFDRVAAVLADKIDEILVGLAKAAPRMVAAIVDHLPEIINAIIDSLPEVIQGFIDQLPRLFVAIEQALPKIAASLAAAQIKLIPEVHKQIVQTFARDGIPIIVESFMDAFGKGIYEMFKELFRMIPGLGFLADAMDKLEEGAEAVADTVEGWLGANDTVGFDQPVDPTTGRPTGRGPGLDRPTPTFRPTPGIEQRDPISSFLSTGGVVGDIRQFAGGNIAMKTGVPSMLGRSGDAAHAARTQADGGAPAARAHGERLASTAPVAGAAKEQPISIVFNARGGMSAVVQKAFAEMFVAQARREGAPVRNARQVVDRRPQNLPLPSSLMS